jgi:hypothetical protein
MRDDIPNSAYEGYLEGVSMAASLVCDNLDQVKAMAAEVNSPMAVYKLVASKGVRHKHYTIPLEWAPRWGYSTSERSSTYIWYRVDPDGKVTEI